MSNTEQGLPLWRRAGRRAAQGCVAAAKVFLRWPPPALLERLSAGLDLLKGPRDVDESFMWTVECWRGDRATKEMGAIDVKVYTVNGDTDEEKLVRTYHLDVRRVERVRGRPGSNVSRLTARPGRPKQPSSSDASRGAWRADSTRPSTN